MTPGISPEVLLEFVLFLSLGALAGYSTYAFGLWRRRDDLLKRERRHLRQVMLAGIALLVPVSLEFLTGLLFGWGAAALVPAALCVLYALALYRGSRRFGGALQGLDDVLLEGRPRHIQASRWDPKRWGPPPRE